MRGPGGDTRPRTASRVSGRLVQLSAGTQTTLTGLPAVPQLEKKQALPPFQPQVTDDYGLDNFDTQFTSEPVQLTPDDE